FRKKKLSINIENIPSTFVLYNIIDPGNLGTIIRTAVVLGRKDLILIDGCHYHNQKTVQASAGTLAHLNIIRTDWNNFYHNLRNKKIPLYGVDGSGMLFSGLEKNKQKNCYLVIGNEAHGIPEHIKNLCDTLLAIPM